MGGNELGKFRAERGYSMEVVEQSSKIAPHRLYEIEAGAMPTDEEMITLYLAIGIDPNRFTGHVPTQEETRQNFVEGLVGLGMARPQAEQEWADVEHRKKDQSAG